MLSNQCRTIMVMMFIGFVICSCADKLSPEQKAEQEKNEIIKTAPIKTDYKINPPSNNLPEKLKAFSGKWVGKWNDVIPSQLIVTDINENEAAFIYSWGSSPQRNIEAGSIRRNASIDSEGKIKFEREGVLYTFVVNTILNKVIGAQINSDGVSNIAMVKVK